MCQNSDGGRAVQGAEVLAMPSPPIRGPGPTGTGTGTERRSRSFPSEGLASSFAPDVAPKDSTFFVPW